MFIFANNTNFLKKNFKFTQVRCYNYLHKINETLITLKLVSTSKNIYLERRKLIYIQDLGNAYFYFLK